MPSSSRNEVDDYPSLLWIVIPPVLLLSAYYARKWYLARKLRLYGIGKGAPGFQTSVRRLRVTPEIAARLRRGEDVSPEEIAEASRRAAEEEKTGESGPEREEAEREREREETPQQEEVNEWLPENITGPKRRSKRKRK